MTEIYFRKGRGIVIKDSADREEVAELKRDLPRNAQRRMTLMGMMAHHVMGEESLAKVPAIVYMTAYAESRTLEKYLASFPQPSPMGFQASIHPSGVEQSLILRQQSVPYFLPLAGLDAFFQALQLAETLPSGSLLIGAEERGTWLAEKQLSSMTSYAWALSLCGEAEADGMLVRYPMAEVSRSEPELGYEDFAKALRKRQSWSCRRPGLGDVQLSWR